jgi:hypothetical protein
MPECVFCGNTKGISVEDILSKWMSRELKRRFPIPVRFQAQRSTPGEADRPYQNELLVMKAKVVCQRPCNNGWMNDMENDVKPIITGMLWGYPRRLTQRQQGIIASWVTMKLMVSEYAYGEENPIYFTPAERAAMRTHRAIPAGTLIWSTLLLDKGAALVTHRHLQFPVVGHPGRTVAGYAAAFVVGRLALLLLSHRFTPQFGSRVAFPIDREFGDATVQIEPCGPQRVKWPPKAFAFDETSVSQFLERWDAAPVKTHLNPGVQGIRHSQELGL